ncbi:MAG TPA: alpha-hydroxy acid oxidase [Gaiellaceae bacterium]|nr:alpha-hydroxy acid oxidase [Gaiellaceae bacterium]
MEPLNLQDYEALACERLAAGPLGYYAGGAGDELTLRDNIEAFRRWQLRPRMLVDVEACTTATTVLGTEVSMPVLVAPTAFQRVAHPDGEVATARAAKAAGTIYCYSTLATSTPAEVSEPGGNRWFQLYVFRDEGITRDLIAQARDNGFGALVLTVDAPVRGNRERDLRTGFAIPEDVPIASIGRGGITPKQMFELISPSLTWRDLDRIASEAGLPLLVKGLLTAEDARIACEHGTAGIVVSNHGGRQLDGVSATIDALPEVVDAVGGRLEVLVDGGVRRGTDVVKALALGAKAVLIGRPVLWGLTCDGEAGVARVLDLLRAETFTALQLVGCVSPAEVTGDRVQRRLP